MADNKDNKNTASNTMHLRIVSAEKYIFSDYSTMILLKSRPLINFYILRRQGKSRFTQRINENENSIPYQALSSSTDSDPSAIHRQALSRTLRAFRNKRGCAP